MKCWTLHYLDITYSHTRYDVHTLCDQCNVIMMSEFVCIRVTFNTLLLTKVSSSSEPALDQELALRPNLAPLRILSVEAIPCHEAFWRKAVD